MNNVVENIEYLVRHHDCVVLPSWGAFIAHYQPSVYDETRNLLLPPSRDISFNPSVAHNDGLLTSSISRRRSIPFAAAAKIVEDEVNAMKHQLDHDGEVALGAVGRFIRQEESTLIFEPSDRLTRYESYGLTPVSAVPLIEMARREAEKRDAVSAETTYETRRRRNFGRMIVRAAAVAASVAVIALVGWVAVSLPSIINRNDNFASVQTTDIFSSRSSQHAAIPAIGGEQLSLNIAMPKAEVVEEVAVTAPEPSSAQSQDVRMNSTDRYCLVVASLTSAELAQKFIREDGNPDLAVFEKDGKYRVYAATGNSTDETYRQRSLRGYDSRYPDAWVCRMN